MKITHAATHKSYRFGCYNFHPRTIECYPSLFPLSLAPLAWRRPNRPRVGCDPSSGRPPAAHHLTQRASLTPFSSSPAPVLARFPARRPAPRSHRVTDQEQQRRRPVPSILSSASGRLLSLTYMSWAGVVVCFIYFICTVQTVLDESVAMNMLCRYLDD